MVFDGSIITGGRERCYKWDEKRVLKELDKSLVQSFAVAKSIYPPCTKQDSELWISYSYNYCTKANRAVFRSVCRVWLSSGPPDCSATAQDCENVLLTTTLENSHNKEAIK